MSECAPWKMKPLDEFEILSMYHDFGPDGARRLNVVMVRNDQIIRASGNDDQYIWNRLWHRARKLEREAS